MDVLRIILTVFEVLASVALILVIMFQSGKEAGLSGAIAGGNQDTCLNKNKNGSLDKMLASARGIAIKAKADVPTGNMVVFSAASGDESAYPYREKNHGMFTYFLLKKLQESRGETTLGELADFISTQVSRRSIVDNAKSQTPTITAYPKLGEQWKNWKLK